MPSTSSTTIQPHVARIPRLVWLLPLLVVLLASGCSKRAATEEEQLAALQGRLTFKAYKAASRLAVPALVGVADSFSDEEPPPDSPTGGAEAGSSGSAPGVEAEAPPGPAIDKAAETAPPGETSSDEDTAEGLTRLVLGYAWAVAKKPGPALAEVQLILELPVSSELTMLARMLRSIVFFDQGWKRLAEVESKAGLALVGKDPAEGTTKDVIMAFHLVLGTWCLYDERYDMARFHFAGFGTITGIMWPHAVVDVLGDIETGDFKGGLVKAKALSTDESIPEELREVLTKLVQEAEAAGGPVESELFWPRIIGSVVLGELEETTKEGFSSLMDTVQELIDSL